MRYLTLIMLLAAFSKLSYCQPFNNVNKIDINNVSATIPVHGDLFWDPASGNAGVDFPKGTGLNPTFLTSLWMSAHTSTARYVAAQLYRQAGNDYWPGPLTGANPITNVESSKWARVWKVSFFEINNHIKNTNRTTSNTPKDILEWPAKGNTRAKGNNGLALTVSQDMAPFVDVDNDGVYDALKGDYPKIKGDQMLWWVFNDNGPAHDNTNGRPLNVQVKASAYAYKRNTVLDNIIYFDFNITNKSIIDYNDFRIATFADVDLGYYRDDYIGFDSARRMGFVYNGTKIDGAGQQNGYGTQMPMSGYVVLEQPGDNANKNTPLGGFVYYNNDATVIGNPQNDVEYDNYLRSKMRDGSPFVNDFSGAHIISDARGVGPATKYVFTGNPADTAEWSECNCNNPVGDRRFLLTSNDYAFKSGSTTTFSFALVVSDLDTNQACPNVDLSSIKKLADTARNRFLNPPKSYVSVAGVSNVNHLPLYPNPVKEQLYITLPNAVQDAASQVVMYNTLGEKMKFIYKFSGSNIQVDTQTLPTGAYYIIYVSKGIQYTGRFIKE